MKKLIFLVAVSVVCSNATAQVVKGMSMIGGSISYNQQSTQNGFGSSSIGDGENKSSELIIGPRYGLMVTDRIMVGVLANYSKASSVYENSYGSIVFPGTETHKMESSGFAGGIFARYYKNIGTGKLAVFVQVSGIYGVDERDDSRTSVSGGFTTRVTSTGNTTSMNVSANIGLVYFLTNRLAVEASFGNIGYRSSTSKSNTPAPYFLYSRQSSSGFNASLGPGTLFLGLNFYFGGAQKEAAPVQP